MRNSLFTACKVGDLNSLNDIISKLERPANLSEGLQIEATTCDSIQIDDARDSGDGNFKITIAKNKYDMEVSDILNQPFGDQERTLLHVTTTQSHKPIICRLLESGADPTIK